MNAIAFMCQPYHTGGVTSWMIDAANEFIKQDFQVYFIVANPVSPFISKGTRTEVVNYLDNAVKVISPNVNYVFELGGEEYRAAVYAEAVRRELPAGIPIILSDDDSVWAGGVAVSARHPLIAVIHSSVDPGYYRLSQKYEKYLSKIVCVSNRTKQNLLKCVGDVLYKTNVIPCGINIESYKRKVTAELSKVEQVIKMLWVGRLEESSKRVSDIPKLASALAKENIWFELKVIGDGAEYQPLYKNISENQLSDRVKLLGWKEKKDIVTEYQNTDIFIQTSNYEGMSVTVMEALAAGCAVVSSRVSGVEDYENSDSVNNCLFLYEIGNIDDAIVKIRKAISVPSALRKEETRMLAEKEFSIVSCVKRYKEVITDCTLVDHQLPLPTTRSFLYIKTKSFFLATLRKIKYAINQRLNK